MPYPTKIQDILDVLMHVPTDSEDLPLLPFSEEQAEVFWDFSRFIFMSGGEGSSKSYLGALKGLTRGLTEGAKLGWLVGADFEDARREANLFIKFVDALGILDRRRSSLSASADQKLVIRLLPSVSDLTVETVSGYDPLKIGREAPDFIVGCEVSRWEQELYERCRGRLARKPGSWGFFSGSPEAEMGWFVEMTGLGQGSNDQEVRSYYTPSWINPKTYPGGRNDPEIVKLQGLMTPQRFAMRHLGRPMPPSDAVFPEFKVTLHVAAVGIEPGFPIHVFVDPGGGGYYAVLFVQFVYNEVHVVDEVYLHGATHEQVINEAMSRPAWRHAKSGVIDVAGTQHHGGFGSPQEAWSRDTGLTLASQYVAIDRTVERLRSVLQINPVTGRARLQINPRCRGLIAEMGGGKPPVPGISLWRMKGGKPDNHNDHACKALGYGLVHNWGTTRPNVDAAAEDEGEEYVSSYMRQRGAYDIPALLRGRNG